jgi:T-complex protein 1 subunit alpha
VLLAVVVFVYVCTMYYTMSSPSHLPSPPQLPPCLWINLGKVILTLADMESDESVDTAVFGECKMVEERKVGDGELLYFRGCKTQRAQSIIIRGANDYMVDEVERSMHDSMCIVKRVLESKALVAGGGAVEAALSVAMGNLADRMGSREQLAIDAFARALLIIPKTLAVNGAHDATDLVAKMLAFHHAAQTNEQKANYRFVGLDLDKGKVRNNLKAGVLEPAMSKVKMIRFATEAAVTILRIDDSIKHNPANDPSGGGH